MKCNEKVEVFTRVVGYFRPVSRWNEGKKEEYEDRVEFVKGLGSDDKQETERKQEPTKD